jgi:hypothetical protein
MLELICLSFHPASLIAIVATGGGLGNKENQVSANTTLEVINT